MRSNTFDAGKQAAISYLQHQVEFYKTTQANIPEEYDTWTCKMQTALSKQLDHQISMLEQDIAGISNITQ